MNVISIKDHHIIQKKMLIYDLLSYFSCFSFHIVEWLVLTKTQFPVSVPKKKSCLKQNIFSVNMFALVSIHLCWRNSCLHFDKDFGVYLIPFVKQIVKTTKLVGLRKYYSRSRYFPLQSPFISIWTLYIHFTYRAFKINCMKNRNLGFNR